MGAFLSREEYDLICKHRIPVFVTNPETNRFAKAMNQEYKTIEKQPIYRGVSQKAYNLIKGLLGFTYMDEKGKPRRHTSCLCKKDDRIIVWRLLIKLKGLTEEDIACLAFLNKNNEKEISSFLSGKRQGRLSPYISRFVVSLKEASNQKILYVYNKISLGLIQKILELKK